MLGTGFMGVSGACHRGGSSRVFGAAHFAMRVLIFRSSELLPYSGANSLPWGLARAGRDTFAKAPGLRMSLGSTLLNRPPSACIGRSSSCSTQLERVPRRASISSSDGTRQRPCTLTPG